MQVFPTDTQLLDIHMTEKAYTWQFILSNIRHKNSYATGNYVAGGPRMPVVEKTRLGLDVNTRCFRRPTTAETDDNSGVTYLEGLLERLVVVVFIGTQI